MVSQNTREAISRFRELLTAEQTVRRLEKDVSACALYVPEVEKEYYISETEKLRSLYEGQESQP